MYDKKTHDIVEECLKEMFKRVGEKYPNKKLTDQEEWYKKRTWTHEEEADYHKWLLKKLKKALPHLRGHKLEMEASMFLLMWGWSNTETMQEVKKNKELKGI